MLVLRATCDGTQGLVSESCMLGTKDYASLCIAHDAVSQTRIITP